MKVFLSWSGAKSKATAEVLAIWLPQVIQAVEPWFSPEDIERGARWQDEVGRLLEEAKIGIICLARENLSAPWILFEAGALSKTKEARVCTCLLDLAPGDVEYPLAQFQHTQANKDDVHRLVGTINAKLQEAGEKPLPPERLTAIFERFWPDLEARLEATRLIDDSVTEPKRSTDDRISEILDTVRAIHNRQTLEALEANDAKVRNAMDRLTLGKGQVYGTD